MKKFSFIKKNDIVVVVGAFVVAALLYFGFSYGSDNPIAEISVNGEVIERLDLTKVTDRIEIKPATSPEVIIVAENGSICFESAECKDKICVSAGKLTKKGDTAVCLPAKTVITIIGSDLDAVTY